MGSTQPYEALVAGTNSLPGLTLTADGGTKAGKPLGAIDFVIEGSDISNRQEKGIQSASASWDQFRIDYITGLDVKDANGRAPLFLLSGNHEASNAIGFFMPIKSTPIPLRWWRSTIASFAA